MLLLYRFQVGDIVPLYIDLHSTMLLLYPFSRVFLPPCSQPFTFHYASTLSPRSQNMLCHIYIYIPLCFYFIRCCEQVSEIQDIIYIPLCFYFIRWSRERTALRISIYIPLCFYFINRLLWDGWKAFWFTFHYASTLSMRLGDGRNKSREIYIPLCFYFITFCSGCNCPWKKIYIPLCFYFIEYVATEQTEDSDLHSTMLLLYRDAFSSCYDLNDYLHSTMLLLYRLLHWIAEEYKGRFTFPYASTLSKDEFLPELSCIRIYIPLCFYFIK